MSVRAKFKVLEVTMYSQTDGKVKLSAVQDTDTPENQRFALVTPNGIVEMCIDNRRVLEQFAPGKYFYADFTEAN
ncbi:MAG TPA: hypothetical protein PKC13_10470 [Blastocatellia bacterium]|nr:hypothetical protein [Blastocatellia bacterium]HMX26015.1 hypothetical protein [Blastocatellia bacterium]HMY72403.1 hypothetical protein [Blastocatellia bacterium]HNG31851.1 hypothetical protein [Blastocatellia bacterium]